MQINIAEIRNGNIRTIKYESKTDKDYITIPLMNDNEEYNRAKAKNLTRRLKEEYER